MLYKDGYSKKSLNIDIIGERSQDGWELPSIFDSITEKMMRLLIKKRKRWKRNVRSFSHLEAIRMKPRETQIPLERINNYPYKIPKKLRTRHAGLEEAVRKLKKAYGARGIV